MIAGPEPEKIALATRLFGSDRGYATPKVDVRAAVFQDDRLLLVRELEDGYWTLPGGWAEVGQSAAESVEREVREESGYIVKAVKLLACLDRNKHPHPSIPFHAYKLVFRCELIGGAPSASSETTEVGFFAEEQIPALSLTRTLPEQIRFVFESLRDPAAPTAFD
jgi:ADP-ribose pyrophosphatase YjhB (NUDIX family)